MIGEENDDDDDDDGGEGDDDRPFGKLFKCNFWITSVEQSCDKNFHSSGFARPRILCTKKAQLEERVKMFDSELAPITKIVNSCPLWIDCWILKT